MNLVDQIPVEIRHVLERNISENASIVDEDIDAAKVLDGSVDDLFAELDAVVVGSGLAAGFSDLLDNEVCGLFIPKPLANARARFICIMPLFAALYVRTLAEPPSPV